MNERGGIVGLGPGAVANHPGANSGAVANHPGAVSLVAVQAPMAIQAQALVVVTLVQPMSAIRNLVINGAATSALKSC